ncbi:MAG: FAD:protein FMN transferase [Ignavibacteriae bacterium]|nr:FAD:protein FMN transferase [Ignavibacteriota bacterium]
MKIGNGIKISKKFIKLNFFASLLFSLILVSCSSPIQRDVYSLAGTTMGTTYSLKVIEPQESKKLIRLDKKIDSVLVDVNNKMSTYIKTSELSLFNQSQLTDWINFSPDLYHVFSTAKRISQESNGSFDITVGPLVNLWGFGPAKKDSLIPSEEQIIETLKNVGMDKIQIDIDNNRVMKNNVNVYCDLSAIAKGYGVDKVGLFLEKVGLNEYMIEIGGEVRTKGKNKNNENWKIGISSPASDGLQKVLEISNYSVATSGDYFNYFEEKGIRYSHTIDPKTGKPITHKLASVTVIHKNCENADAYATAIDVLGPEAGYDFALKLKLPVFMIVRENENFIEKMTPQFEEFVRKEK